MPDDARSPLKPVSCYVSPAPAARNKIADWYSGLTVRERTDADVFIKTMRQKTEEWAMPDYRPSLKGYPKLGELRWKSGQKQHRLIGHFKGGVFIALIGCTHKMNIYDPSSALEEADKRLDRITKREATTCEYKL
jgi:hypothetical protein